MAGDDVYIDTTAEVHQSATVGTGSAIWNWTKVRENVSVGRDCNIGQGVYVDPGVVIGDGCSIHNNVSIYEGVTLGNQVFVGGQVCCTNDLYPRAGNRDWKVVPTLVEGGASIGANATIVCGVTLGANCMVGAGAVATDDVPAHALVVGQPARVIDFVSTGGARLHHDIGPASRPIPAN
jgi:acetyltransferase-like isoleucine patch superfamily enzyme